MTEPKTEEMIREICGGITINDSNDANKYRVVMRKVSNYDKNDWRKTWDPEFATGLVPYAYTTNNNPNIVEWEFWDQSAIYRPSRLRKIKPTKSMAVNMETGASQDEESIALGVVFGAALLLGAYSYEKKMSAVANIGPAPPELESELVSTATDSSSRSFSSSTTSSSGSE